MRSAQTMMAVAALVVLAVFGYWSLGIGKADQCLLITCSI